MKAKQYPGSSMVGVGITPEGKVNFYCDASDFCNKSYQSILGINQNYVMYEFALNQAWYQNSTDVPNWINAYVANRYGIENVHLQNAWEILRV